MLERLVETRRRGEEMSNAAAKAAWAEVFAGKGRHMGRGAGRVKKRPDNSGCQGRIVPVPLFMFEALVSPDGERRETW